MNTILKAKKTQKWVLVTGAAKRIGNAISLALHKAGYAVILHYNNSEKAINKLKNQIINDAGHAVAINANFNNINDIIKLSMFCKEYNWWGLVNNASYFANDYADNINIEIFDEHMRINVKAPQILSEAIYKQKGKNIIHIIDNNIHLLQPPFYSYNISRIALSAMLKMQCLKYSPNTNVNGIAPGLVLQSNIQTKDKFKYQHNLNPLKLGVGTSDISRTLLFILNSPVMTGQLITIDSGQSVMNVK